MIKANELIAEAEALPLDLKTLLIDRLLNSLSPSSKEVDELWAKEAERRVKEIKAGLVTPIEGEKVFQEIQERLSK
jgi:putative addiction module component (TIGR02574 family)